MKNRHIGSDFDDFLAEEGLLAEVEAIAKKRVLVYQLQQEMVRAGISNVEMASKMNVTQSKVDCLLNSDDPSVDLQDIERAVSVLKITLKVNPYPIRIMTPADILILESFLFAISQQTRELSNAIELKINEIARDLETRIMDLHNLAIATPALAELYQTTYDFLADIDAERTKRGENSAEIENATRAIDEFDTNLNKLLDKMSEDYKQGAELLKKRNLWQTVSNWLQS